LSYVKEQTEKICLEAVKMNPCLLKHVKIQTPEICLEAIIKNIDLMHYVNLDLSNFTTFAEKLSSLLNVSKDEIFHFYSYTKNINENNYGYMATGMSMYNNNYGYMANTMPSFPPCFSKVFYENEYHETEKKYNDIRQKFMQNILNNKGDNN